MLKKVLILGSLMAFAIGVAGCSQSVQTDHGVARPYGVFNSTRADPKVKYTVSAGDVILTIIFSETILVPLYILGFDIMEPSTEKSN